MNIKKISIFTFLVATLAMVSCGKSDDNGGNNGGNGGGTGGGDKSDTTFVIKPSISAFVAKSAAVTAFKQGDVIDVFAWTGAANSAPSAFQVNGVKNTNGSSWTPSKSMVWKDKTTTHNVVSVFPSSSSTYDLANIACGASDILIGSTATDASKGSTVSLSMKHIMANLNIKLSFQDGFVQAGQKVSISFNGVSLTGKYNYYTKAYSLDAASALEYSQDDVAVANGGTYQFSTVLLPQSIDLSNLTLTVGAVTFPIEGTYDLEAGKTTTISLPLTIPVDVVVAPDVDITDWDPELL